MQEKIAIILYSDSHTEYTAQVVNPRNQIDLHSYGIGKFVLIGEQKHIGIIFNTQVFNPSMLTINHQKEAVSLFAPDLLDQVELMLKILVIGSLNSQAPYNGEQELVSIIFEAGTIIYTCPEEVIKQFHYSSENKIQIKYLSYLNDIAEKYNPGLFQIISKKLKNLLPEKDYKIINLIEKNLTWEKIS